MAFELTEANVRLLVEMVRRAGLENVLLSVGFACMERASTFGGAAHDAWMTGRDICNEAADMARKIGL